MDNNQKILLDKMIEVEKETPLYKFNEALNEFKLAYIAEFITFMQGICGLFGIDFLKRLKQIYITFMILAILITIIGFLTR